ncbi:MULTISPECIES: hypothetical protein [unclassified Clostridium]|uniref:hypothetical protein n=1 Tax=unclassified Clostridium TaxID=2614128 RepID=UPI00189887FB|nr:MULTISPECIES: hypothetical protein [unclassified Clostridium]
MFIIGEIINTNSVNSKRESIEFERYCKDEKLSSIEVRREIYKSSKNKSNRLLKNLKILVKMIF